MLEEPGLLDGDERVGAFEVDNHGLRAVPGLDPGAPQVGGEAVEVVERVDPAARRNEFRAVVLVDEGQYLEVDLFGVPLDGSAAPTRLNLQQSSLNAFEVVPSTDRIVYWEQNNLYSIRPDGTGRVQLDPGQWVPNKPGQFQLTANGQTVVFGASNSGLGAIYRAPIDGSASAVAVVAPGTFSIQAFELVNVTGLSE